jgi:hypothetical protein
MRVEIQVRAFLVAAPDELNDPTTASPGKEPQVFIGRRLGEHRAGLVVVAKKRVLAVPTGIVKEGNYLTSKVTAGERLCTAQQPPRI